ncbi:MAG: hypothetical protein INR73_20545 [Williamsia sp.]|nr:hypothetical protein [Williamsia sp.]
MRLKFYYICCLFLFCCCSALCQSVSVNITADKNKILIGEPIHLQLEATVPENVSAAWFSTDSLSHFEVISKGKIDTLSTDEGNKYRQTIAVTSFDSGYWSVPPLALIAGERSYLTDSIPVSVSFTPFDANQPYHDIKSILDVENPVIRYINWIIAGVTVLSLLAVVYFLRKPLPVVVQPVKQKTSLLTPLEEALAALETVKKQQLVQQGKLKLYYTSLNDILRDFIQKKMLVSMMEKTNEELILQLKRWDMPNEAVITLAQALRMSDVVKFAKYVPGERDNEQNFHTIKTSVEVLNNLK